MELTADAVDAMMVQCLSATCEPEDSITYVEGVRTRFAFNSERVRDNAIGIGELLAALPANFQADRGGGSFLDACMDHRGHQWTGLHQMVECLLCLGIAAGRAQWLLPRADWVNLPGGMPFVVVNMSGTGRTG